MAIAAARRAAQLRREAEEAAVEAYPLTTEGGGGASRRAKRGLRRALFRAEAGGSSRSWGEEGDWGRHASPERGETTSGQPEGLGSPELQRSLRAWEDARREGGSTGPEDVREVLREAL